MPKISITRPDGVVIEAEVSFDEFTQLAGINGHKPITQSPTNFAAPAKKPGRPAIADKQQDVAGFVGVINARAKKFLAILKQNPMGVESHDLADVLGFKGPGQIGGIVGPLTRIAKKYGIRKANDLFRSEVQFIGEQKRRMFYPGKLTEEMQLQ